MGFKWKSKRVWACLLAVALLLSVFSDKIVAFAQSTPLEVSDDIAVPVFDIESGVYEEDVITFLTSSDKEVYYTTDGTIPTLESQKYNRYLQAAGSAGKSVTTTITAVAVKEIDGVKYRSKEAVYTYTIEKGSTVTLVWGDTIEPVGVTDEEAVANRTVSYTVPYGTAMDEVLFNAATGYYFPEGSSSTTSGITVERVNSGQIKDTRFFIESTWRKCDG